MKTSSIYIMLLLSIQSYQLIGQQNQCHNDFNLVELFDDEEERKVFLNRYQEKISNNSHRNKSLNSIYSIPVVVHIIHQGDPLGSSNNPTDEAVELLIKKTSQIFRNKHQCGFSFSNP